MRVFREKVFKCYKYDDIQNAVGVLGAVIQKGVGRINMGTAPEAWQTRGGLLRDPPCTGQVKTIIKNHSKKTN